MHTVTLPAAPRNLGDAAFEGVFDHSLNFTIELEFDDVCQFIRRIGRSNDFDPECVIGALETVDDLIPRSDYGPGNPNTGKRDFTIRIGREGSPVLYLERLEWGERERLSDESLRLICREMGSLGLADEADFTIKPFPLMDGRRITFRFWWD